MNDCSDTAHLDSPGLLAAYRSEAFAEDLDPPAPPRAGWGLLERLVAALPFLCVLAPVADAYLIH